MTQPPAKISKHCKKIPVRESVASRRKWKRAKTG